MLQNRTAERELREFCSTFFVRRALSLGFYNLYEATGRIYLNVIMPNHLITATP